MTSAFWYPVASEIYERLYLRRGDNDLCIHKMLVERRVLALLVGRRDELMTLIFQPFPDSKLVFCSPKKFWNFSGVFMAL